MSHRRFHASALASRRARHPWLARLLDTSGRSLFPLVALVLIAGTALWGPWITLALVAVWWTLVTRFA